MQGPSLFIQSLFTERECAGPSAAVGLDTAARKLAPARPQKGLEVSGEDQVSKDTHLRQGFLPVGP